jgi:hypothetical protein
MADMPKADAAALLARATAFAADPFAPHPWAAPMHGTPDRVRIRYGNWRAITLIMRARDSVIIERAGHRREVYR